VEVQRADLTTTGPAVAVGGASAPLRLSLAGGGRDLPEYYLRSPARVLSVAVDIRMSVRTVPAPAGDHSPLVSLFRSLSDDVGVEARCDVSAGAGLGGSGALAVCLVMLARHLAGEDAEPVSVALEAFEWERRRLGQPVGFQDHLVAALGGCVDMSADASGISARRRPDLEDAIDELLETCVVVAETGSRRSSHEVLDQVAAAHLEARAALSPPSVRDVEAALLARDGPAFGRLLGRHWESKRAMAPKTTNDRLDAMVDAVIGAGALGAKVVGAGGGGFVMASGPADRRDDIAAAFERLGCLPVRFRVERAGAGIILADAVADGR
jgi:D-glycero-alpha-D-manno-heptose-7-phosphate kinase